MGRSKVDVQRGQAIRVFNKGGLPSPPDIKKITVTQDTPNNQTFVSIELNDLTGYDVGAIEWRGTPFVDDAPLLTYYLKDHAICKDGVKKAAWVINMAAYKPPELLTRTASPPSFLLKFAVLSPGWSIVPQSVAANDPDLILGPLYDAKD